MTARLLRNHRIRKTERVYSCMRKPIGLCGSQKTEGIIQILSHMRVRDFFMSFAIWICAGNILTAWEERGRKKKFRNWRQRSSEKTELKITKKMNFWDFAAKRSERIIMRMMIFLHMSALNCLKKVNMTRWSWRIWQAITAARHLIWRCFGERRGIMKYIRISWQRGSWHRCSFRKNYFRKRRCLSSIMRKVHISGFSRRILCICRENMWWKKEKSAGVWSISSAVNMKRARIRSIYAK